MPSFVVSFVYSLFSSWHLPNIFSVLICLTWNSFTIKHSNFQFWMDILQTKFRKRQNQSVSSCIHPNVHMESQICEPKAFKDISLYSTISLVVIELIKCSVFKCSDVDVTQNYFHLMWKYVLFEWKLTLLFKLSF